MPLVLLGIAPCNLMYSSWARTNAPLVLPGTASCDLDLSGHCPTHPWSFQETSYANLCSPRECRPTHPWSFRAPLHAPLIILGTVPCALGPSRRRPTPRDKVAACSRRMSPRKNATVAMEEGQLGSSCEIWIEKEKQKKDSPFLRC